MSTAIASNVPVAWECGDCKQTGAITVSFPIHPDELASRIHAEHLETQHRRHCMCPGHYLQFWPIKS